MIRTSLLFAWLLIANVQSVMAADNIAESVVSAGDTSDTSADSVVADVLAALNKQRPDLEIEWLDFTPIPGLYELASNGKIYYVNQDAT